MDDIRGVMDASDNRAGVFPQVAEALSCWTNPMTFRLVTDTTVDFENVQVTTDYPFLGVFQPMPSRDIFLKPDAQRSWKWWTLYTTTNYPIKNGDTIIDKNGMIFRVMKTNDWSEGGFYVFELVQDYEVRPGD
jgi:hypothetical protein